MCVDTYWWKKVLLEEVLGTHFAEIDLSRSSVYCHMPPPLSWFIETDCGCCCCYYHQDRHEAGRFNRFHYMSWAKRRLANIKGLSRDVEILRKWTSRNGKVPPPLGTMYIDMTFRGSEEAVGPLLVVTGQVRVCAAELICEPCQHCLRGSCYKTEKKKEHTC